MSNLSRNKHILSEAFLAFYAEIAMIKSVLLSDNPQLVLPEKLRRSESQGSAAPDYQMIAAYLSRRLENYLLERRKEVQSHCTSLQIKLYQQAEYVMVALADELFILDLDWEGANYWQKFLLERRLYKSEWAGEIFFNKLRMLLADKSQNELIKDLAIVFLLAIRIGFSGKYRGNKRDLNLGKFQSDLIKFIGNGKPRSLFFTQAYSYIQNQLIPARLAPFAPWIKGAAIIFLIYLLTSSLVWISSIGSLVRSINDDSLVTATESETPVQLSSGKPADSGGRS